MNLVISDIWPNLHVYLSVFCTKSSIRDTYSGNKRGKHAAILSGFTHASRVTFWQFSIPYVIALPSHVKVKVKQSRYSPEVAQSVPGS